MRVYVNKVCKTLRRTRFEEYPPTPGRIENPSHFIRECRPISGIGVLWPFGVVDHEALDGPVRPHGCHSESHDEADTSEAAHLRDSNCAGDYREIMLMGNEMILAAV